MRNKKLCLYLFLLIITLFYCAPFVFADLTYPQMGGDDYTYKSGDGRFRQENQNIQQTGLDVLSNPTHMPLVQDLDNDGINEILVFAGSTITAYNGEELTIVGQITLPNQSLDTPTETGPVDAGYMITYDIDGDSYHEVIVSSDATGYVEIIDYDNSTFQKKYGFKVPMHDTGIVEPHEGRIMFACADTNNCLAVINQFDEYHNGNGNVSALPFTSSSTGNLFHVYGNHANVNLLCLPTNGAISVVDYDSDGVNEYAFSYFQIDSGTASQLPHLGVRIGMSDGTDFTLERGINKTGTFFVESPSAVCSSYENKFTQPLVADIKGTSAQKEIVVGYMTTTADRFKMVAFDIAGNQINEYPRIQTANGDITSNVFLMDAFGRDGRDFCVLGFYDDGSGTKYHNLLCATETGALASAFGIFNVSSEEFIYELGAGDSIITTGQTALPYTVVHSGDHTQDVDSDLGENLDEIITPYGVFKLEFNTFNFLTFLTGASFQSDLILESSYPQASVGVAVPVDVTKTAPNDPLSDILFLTYTNLFYFDDGFSNTNAYIGNGSINPCVNSPWAINTTVGVNFKVFDNNSDTVRASAVLYHTDSNEQVQNFTSYYTSGAEFAFSFVANKTISNGVLTIFAQDSEHNSSLTSETWNFDVTNNGVSFGDCKTNFDLTPSSTGLNGQQVFGEGETNTDDNAIKSAINIFSQQSGLGNTFIWLIIMTVISYGVWASTRVHGSWSIGALLIINFFMLVMGTILGFIASYIVISIVVVSFAIVSVFAWKGLSGGS